jgi:hypothetical protein
MAGGGGKRAHQPWQTLRSATAKKRWVPGLNWPIPEKSTHAKFKRAKKTLTPLLWHALVRRGLV